MSAAPAGRVYLVGAGPGDPGLITVRGLEVLRSADVVVYDHLASPFLLAEAPPRAERVYAGKERGEAGLTQTEIEALLVERARAGQRVVRLKGGDPFVFGRGGEEALALAAAGVRFEVVPGVTSAFAVPAYAGIPVTHRGVASSVHVATAHAEPHEGGAAGGDAAGCRAGTLVLLMVREQLRRYAEELVAGGRPPQTPAALVRWGTTPEQETLVGTLGDLADRADERGVEPPVVLVVGEVVRLRERLGWWDRRPLFGRRVLVTRAREQAQDLVRALEAEGASTVAFPTIEIVPPHSWEALDRALDHVGAHDWIVFTSTNAVRRTFARLAERGGDLRALAGVRIAAVGSSTAEAVRQHGLVVDLVPEAYRAEGLVAALTERTGRDVRGLRVLLPRAAVAREILPEELARHGAEVTVAEAYRTTSPQVPVEALARDLAAGRIHYVTFTSSSTVRNFVEAWGGGVPPLGAARVACIGPLTAQTARDSGLDVAVVAVRSTIPDLVAALVADARSHAAAIGALPEER